MLWELAEGKQENPLEIEKTEGGKRWEKVISRNKILALIFEWNKQFSLRDEIIVEIWKIS